MIERKTESLSEIVNRVKVAHSIAVDSATKADGARLEAGRALIAAKRIVPHGEWMDWVEIVVGISHATACRYMRRAEGIETVVAHCIPEIIAAVDAGTVEVEDAAAVAFSPPDVQAKCLARYQAGAADTLLQTLEDGWPTAPESQPREPNESGEPTVPMCQVCRRRVRLKIGDGQPLQGCPTCLALRNELAAQSPPTEREPAKPGKMIREWLAKIRQELGNQDHGDPHYDNCMLALSDLTLALTAWPALEVPDQRHTFEPPTLVEVANYCEERAGAGHPRINPAAFIAFYESKGWIVGKAKMIDWRAAVRTWEANETARRNQNGTREPIRPGATGDTLDRIEAKTIRAGEIGTEPGSGENPDPVPG